MFWEQIKPVRPVQTERKEMKQSLDAKAQDMLSFMNIMYSTDT